MILQTIILNFVYAMGGIIAGLSFMFVGFKVFDSFTKFDTSDELKKGNIAVGITTASIFLSVALMTALIIGMALN